MAGFDGGIRNQLPCTERRRNYRPMAVITGVFCLFRNSACSFNEVSFTIQLFALLPSCMNVWFGPERQLIRMFSSVLRRCFFSPTAAAAAATVAEKNLASRYV